MKIDFASGKATESAGAVKARRPVDELFEGESGPSERGSSYYKTLLMCPFEFALTYENGIGTAGTGENLAIGNIFHKALEAYYKHILLFQQELDAKHAPHNDHYYFGCIFEAQEAAFRSIAHVASEPGYVETYEEVRRLLEAYFEKYWNHDKWRIIAVEETLHFKERGFEYSARIDLIVEMNGRTWIVEHKTARTASLESLDGYDMDPQTLGQFWLFETCVDTSKLPPLAGVLVNVTAKTKTVGFARKDVCPSNAHLAMFERSVGGWTSLRTVNKKLGWPRYLGHCAGFARGYAKCTYFDVCRNFPGLSPEQIARKLPEGFIVKDTKAA